MRLIRFETPDGRTLCGIPIHDTTAAVLPSDALGDQTPTGETAPIGRLLAPVAPPNIFCIGLNYRAHAAETGAPIPGDKPVVFMKPTTAVVGPGDPIMLPAACEHGPEVDFEAELAVVIGRTARDVGRRIRHWSTFWAIPAPATSRPRRLAKTAGGGGQMESGARASTASAHWGQVLVTADEIPDPQASCTSSCVNQRPNHAAGSSDFKT